MNLLQSESNAARISSALRYERVAQLEAVLTLRDQRLRNRFRMTIVTGLVIAAGCTALILLLVRSLG